MAEILERYPRLIVPGLGAFEWQYQSASLENKGQLLQPPSYSLIFNPELQEDPLKLLENKLVQKEFLPLEEAQQTIAHFVAEQAPLPVRAKDGLLPSLQATFKDQPILAQNYYPEINCQPILRQKSYLEKGVILEGRKKKSAKAWYAMAGLGLCLATALVTAPWWGPQPEANTTPMPSILPLVTEQQEAYFGLIQMQREQLKNEIAEEELSEALASGQMGIPLEEKIAEEQTSPLQTTSAGSLSSPLAQEEPTIAEKTPKEIQEEISPKHLDQKIVVIGVFQEDFNTERNKAELEAMGYKVQVKKLYTGLFRVAALVPAHPHSRFEQELSRIRQEVIAQAWVAEE
ncbi:sporulation protein [Saprospira sp. CCB-QB6]|uniref:HU domain-containing protein n=1 Tax=Saprospira sp. CCB-QB6 TaxID=3023936 RepID=UPI00234AFCDC|nr:sporulation protein [Saprospira sp. CCB-QB6]WCL80904.1 sporulation protein [Saprospira sp. CCB-QB6]